MVSHGDMTGSKELKVVLPNGCYQTFHVSNISTVHDVKVICECCIGIPVELQRISLHTNSAGNDKRELQDGLLVPKSFLRLQVPIWWEKFICAVLNNEVENVFRRVQLPMQRLGKDERVFVALLMGCCGGREELVVRLMNIPTKVSLGTASDSGRTLLHACASSGSISCLEIITRHLMSSCFDCFESLDVNKETAYEIALRRGHKEVAEQLLKYTNTSKNKREPSKSATKSLTAIPETTKAPNSPHQRQANSNRKINSTTISHDRVVEKNKQNQLSECSQDINDGDSESENSARVANLVLTLTCEEVNVDSIVQDETKQTPDMYVIGSTTSPSASNTGQQSCSSRTERENRAGKPISPILISSQPFYSLHREKEHNTIPCNAIVPPNINVSDESSEDETERNIKTLLPAIGYTQSLPGLPGNTEQIYQVYQRHGRKMRVVRSMSSPNSPEMSPRISPTNSSSTDTFGDTRSAPNSPPSRRSLHRSFKATGLKARYPVSGPLNATALRVKTSKEQSEPVTSLIANRGVKLNRFRRSSLASNVGINHPIQRGKSRSVCEVTLNESFQSHFLNHKAMETEERMELPWNAWIAAKRREATVQPGNTLAPMPEERQLNIPQSPNERRRSFQQWLNEKDLEQLREQHAEAQLQERADAEKTGRQARGKSFDEWLEDKHADSQREKEKMREKEEAQKGEDEKKLRRRRMSQQKYQSWLQEKELKALEEEEKLLGEEQQKLEKLKVKWEEEDEVKRKSPMATRRLPVERTKSCPTTNSTESNQHKRISRQRFSSLQVTTK